MKLQSKTISKLLTLVAIAGAGLAITFPAKALVNSFDNLHLAGGNQISQDLPPAETPAPTDVPTPVPGDVPTPAPTDVPLTPPPTDATPAPEPTDTPSPEPTETPAPEPTETPAPESTETPAPEASEPPAKSAAPEKGSFACLNNPNPSCK
jgi:outer membrane biosynthesis protein TonB